MSRFILTAVFLIVALAPAGARTQARPSGTTDQADQVDKVFERWDKPTSPGCALAVMKNGAIVYKHGYGMADLDHDVPITPASVFHVASVSKQFTATAIVLLAQKGKLSLDDEVRKYIPELPDFGAPITIRHLIHHTSGLRDQWELLGLAGWRYSLDLITDGDVLELVSRQKELNFRPGEKHMYCNTGYTLLAMIVKRVSGQAFREFTRANIFQPLGMNDTHFRDDHAEVVKRQAYGYVPGQGDSFRLSVTNFDTVGATSLLTTAEDLALWDRNFYDPRVGGAALIEQLQQRGRLSNGEQLNYAFGLVHGKYKGLPVVEHSGSDAGYRAHVMRFPEQRFSVACLCNAGPASPSQLARKVADLYLASELKEPPAAGAETPRLSQQQLSSKVGLYANRESEQVRKIALQDGKLRMILLSDDNYELRPLSEDRFRAGDTPLEVRFESAWPGGPLRLAESAGGGKPKFFEAISPPPPTPAELDEYAGAYGSDEIEAVYRVVIENGRLVVRRLKFRAAILEPVVRDVFYGRPLGYVRFTRDANQRVAGAVLNNGRIRNFRFTKKAP